MQNHKIPDPWES